VHTEVRAFVGRAVWFVLIGLVIYGAVYAANERVIAQHAQRNRFFAIKNAPHDRYDYVILGASHAAVFGYRDMNTRLEQMTGARIMNLSVVGGGVMVARLLMEYFLARHDVGTVVYVVDSFAFYSSRWNEGRLQDTALYARAPFDPMLAALLVRNPVTRTAGLDYVVGFSKINNPDRFAPDVLPDEGNRFDRTYRPVPQIDRERINYLYPQGADARVRDRSLNELEALIASLQGRGVRFIAIKPPIPSRMQALLPLEDGFNATIRRVFERRGVAFHDLSGVANEDRHFYDTDHLNRAGVLRFFETALVPVLKYSTN